MEKACLWMMVLSGLFVIACSVKGHAEYNELLMRWQLIMARWGMSLKWRVNLFLRKDFF